ncbi:MAG TPA: DUF1428 domain-containing protein [Polyangiales bacterium]|nr:DUF1428 domain-containing protein [Polyangiales bacterium]
MALYIDGFVTPVPKKNIAKYTAASKRAGKIMLKYGALEYVDCVADDVPDGKVTSFPMAVKLKKDEVVCFAYTIYKNRKHRDAVTKKAMHDPIFQDPDMMPFDGKRMIFGGFKRVVIAKKKG